MVLTLSWSCTKSTEVETVYYLTVSFWFTNISLALSMFLQLKGKLPSLAPSGLWQHQKIARSNINPDPQSWLKSPAP